MIAKPKCCEKWTWEQAESILNNLDITAAELERRKMEGEDSREQLHADLEAARREYKRLEDAQARLIRRLRDDISDDLAALLEKEIARTEADKTPFKNTIKEIEARLAAEDGVRQSLTVLTE